MALGQVVGQVGIAYLNPRQDFRAATAILADRGHELRSALFEDCLPEDRNAANEVQDWFDSLVRDPAKSFLMTVHADPILPVPWGLVHESGTFVDGSDVYESFWALRHNVVALYNGMAPRRHRNA